MEKIARYSKEHIDFLKEMVNEKWDVTAEEFNKKFNTNKSKQTLMWLASVNNIKKKIFLFTKEHEDWLRENKKDLTYKELTVIFNDHFNLDRPYESIRRFGYTKGISNGYTGRFEKGHKPWNVGKKGLCLGGNAGWFKKGHRPANYREVGSERVDKYGYTYVKIEAPNKWRAKHLIIWENAHGKIPNNHSIIFADRDKQNFELNNLMLVNKSELLKLNSNGYITTDKELTKAGLNLVKLDIEIRKKVKK